MVWIGIFIIILMGIVWARDRFTIQRNETFSASVVGQVTNVNRFTRADGSHTWDFPTDFGPHPDYQTEWWYYTGNLRTKEGRRFGYQLTFFRRGLTPAQDAEGRDSAWGTYQVYMGHFALSDTTTENHYVFQRFSRGAAGLAGAQVRPFQVWLENWEVVEKSNGEWELKAEQDRVRIDLVLADEKGLVFHGIDGYSQKGPEIGSASYYFSQTRLDSTGVVKIEDSEFQVTGLSWMDHEFSTSALSDDQVGWDWFSLQLDDGTDLMMFQIRRADGSIDPFSSGTVVNVDGETIHLDRDNFDIQINDTWRSPRSGAAYPADWTIVSDKLNLNLKIEPYMADQEMNLSFTYWEGAVGIRGTIKGQLVTGSGYAELTGYGDPMRGRF